MPLNCYSDERLTLARSPRHGDEWNQAPAGRLIRSSDLDRLIGRGRSPWKKEAKVHKSREVVRVRFAPSPTGYLHVGGARTAIFNWLYARSREGAFVLRIEDTDVQRSSRESEMTLMEDLEWLGLDWDEGPGKGGEFLPYRQSERLALYGKESERLVSSRLAYPCFCREEDLERKRKEALSKGQSPHYDGSCRELSQAEIGRLRDKGTPEAVRFKVPRETIVFNDCIRGRIEMSTSMVGDFVLMRSNGLPTYNFAAVVDDHSMGITHVLRGEEHLPNTLRQILLYRAMKLNMPVFGHLPLILGGDRSKLSKRHGAFSISELRNGGFLPQAVMNYLALLGWSHSSGEEILSVEELIEDFSLERVNKSAAVFDMDKLRWVNGMHIRRLSLDELFDAADRYIPSDLRQDYDENARRKMLLLLQKKIEVLSDVGETARVFAKTFELDDEAKDSLKGAKARSVLEALVESLEEQKGELTEEDVKAILKKVGSVCNASGKELYFPVRAAVTGKVHGPDLAGIMTIKGRSAAIELLRRALSRI